jgi:hypothetical protein
MILHRRINERSVFPGDHPHCYNHPALFRVIGKRRIARDFSLVLRSGFLRDELTREVTRRVRITINVRITSEGGRDICLWLVKILMKWMIQSHHYRHHPGKEDTQEDGGGGPNLVLRGSQISSFPTWKINHISFMNMLQKTMSK